MIKEIQLTIDIDESIYRHFMNNRYSRTDIIAIHTAIVNGTVLPKRQENKRNEIHLDVDSINN